MKFKELLFVSKQIALAIGLTSFSGVPVFAEPKFEIYGHVNLGILYQNDGGQSQSFLADNNNSNSRLGIRWTNPDLAVGTLSFNVEASLGATQSSSVNIAAGNNFKLDWDRRQIRKFDLSLKTNSYGTFSLGQGSMASDGIAYFDLSGTANISGAYVASTSGGLLFRSTSGAVSTNSVASGVTDFDGARRFRFRYDSPTVSNFTFSGAIGREILAKGNDEDYGDIAVRYANNGLIPGTDFKAGIGYNWRTGATDFWGGSLGLLHRDSGLNLHIAAGQDENQAGYGFVKLGVIKDFFGPDMKTAFSIDYFASDDVGGAGVETDSAAFSVVQYLPNKLQLFAQYRTHGRSDTTDTYLDGNAVYVGARYNFSF